MPTPSGFNSGTLSKIRHGTPIWCRLSASVSPPMPPPAMRTVMSAPLPKSQLGHDTGKPRWATAKRLRRLALSPVEASPGLEHEIAQPDRSGVHLRAGRIEHVLLVHAGVDR